MTTREGGFTPTSVAEAAARAVDAVAFPQPSTEEGRRVEENFDILRTHRLGFYVLVDHGDSADQLTRSGTDRLHDLGSPYVAIAVTIKALEALQSKPPEGALMSPHDELEKFGELVRGARNEIEGWEVQINPQRKQILDIDLIAASGDKAAGTVHRRVAVLVELDPKKDDVEGFVSSMQRRLKRQGSTAEVGVERTSRVDEDELERLIESGEVVLLPGAWREEITRRNVVPRVISSEAEREAVKQAVIETPDAPEDTAN